MDGTKHVNFNEEALNIANNIMLRNGVEFESNDENIDIYEELKIYNEELRKLGLAPASIEEYCEVAGYNINDFIDTSFNWGSIMEDYVEGEEEGINVDTDVDTDEWGMNNEYGTDDWAEDGYKNESTFDDQ